MIDLKPGDYALRIALHEPPPADSCGWGQLLGEYPSRFHCAEQRQPRAILSTSDARPHPSGRSPAAMGDRARISASRPWKDGT